MSTRYYVYITPRSALNEYGDEVDVSQYIEFDGLPVLKRGIDAADYSFGVFTYGDIQLKAINKDGYLNDENDSRSMFRFSRDLAKVRVVFSDGDDTITFNGLINEEATRIDAEKERIEFRVLSQDSIIRNTNVAAGVVSNGMLCSAAIAAILNSAEITSVLTFSESDINPDLDFEIDDGSHFDNKSTREALNELLLASNSVLLIDSDALMIVRNREAGEERAVLNLYGPHDTYRRDNIIGIRNFNQGKHRMFTAVKVNDIEESNTGYIIQFGYRQRKFTLDFITDDETASDVAERLLEEFEYPKIELEVIVPTWVARNSQILDRVSISHPLQVKPFGGRFLPVVGHTKIDQADEPLPYIYGSTAIDANTAFKIIEIQENAKTFETTLKLRQAGTEPGDGIFRVVGNAIVGFAVIGSAVIPESGDPDATWNPSVLGAARLGSTETA